MLNSIKKYFKKAKEEVSKEYSINSPVQTSSRKDESSDSSKTALPKVWTGVDLDGTLAYYDRMSAYDEVGEPIPGMMTLVKKMINNGIRVKIFTARAQDPEQLSIIRKWMKNNNLPELEITNVKDYNMHRLYDDRCVQVERNTGRLIVDN
ncbi:MAG: hypothetical protein GY699_03430 [Desulfobacteraceae bacterium]|nr:hypothetical protein [Desulfobacteraceae bacterium]